MQLRRVGVAVVTAWLGAAGAASPAIFTFCRANVLCTMLSGLECNRSGGRCPPCIFQRATGAIDCRDKIAMEPSCPQLELPLLVDCDSEISTPSISPATTAQSMSPVVPSNTSNSLSTTQHPSNKGPLTTPSSDDDKSTVYWAIALSAVVCVVLGAICYARTRRPQRRHLEAPDIELMGKVRRDPIDHEDVSIPPPVILFPDSQRDDLLDPSPHYDTRAFISVSSGPSSVDEDDILSTVFMRFRTTVDYANDERNSAFSMLSAMDSPDTVSTDDEEVDI